MGVIVTVFVLVLGTLLVIAVGQSRSPADTFHERYRADYSQPNLAPLEDAMRRQLQVRIGYENGDGGRSNRTLDIYGVERSGHFHAFCHKRREPRTFRADRITSWALTGSTFARDDRVARYLASGKDMTWALWLELSGKTAGPVIKGTDVVEQNMDWLRPRWDRAATEKAARRFVSMPKWFFHKATQRQLGRLQRLGVDIPAEALTKGKASDIIGLFVEPEKDGLSVLKFFKQPTGNLSQTRAREHEALLLLNADNLARWEGRPPTARQKAFFAVMGLTKPKGLTITTAESVIDEQVETWEAQEDPCRKEWEAFEDIIDELDDKDVREDLEIKKPAFSLITTVAREAREEGRSLVDLASDMDAFAELLLAAKPALRRA